MRSSVKFAFVCAAAALAGCAENGRDADIPADSEAAAATLDIHRPYTPGAGSVNSYWLEGRDEILVFDTQRSPELAERVVDQIEATGKPVHAIVISHYHPDHFGGLAVFREAFPDAELLMTEDLAGQLADDPSEYVAGLAGEEEEPPVLPEPDRIITDGDELTISGVTVVVDIVPEAEAAPVTMLAIPSQRVLFASDLVAARMHPNLTDANIDSWPRALDRITRDYEGYRLFPGHGEPGPTNLLAANQTAYLNFVRTLVQNEILADDIATEAEIRAAIGRVESNYAGWDDVTGRPGYMRRNLLALVDRLGGRLERTAGEPPGEAVSSASD